ncbi:MAG: ABC transporter ATP-binding protein, partial [Acidobacteria bacterium]|nr:ABC transporter ATP-binding protein [Acidobacteriota bacterium]
VDTMSDRVVLINNGYILAEGGVTGVREEIEDHPMQVMIRSNLPRDLAIQLLAAPHIVEVQLLSDRQGLFVKSTSPDELFLTINRLAIESSIDIEAVTPVDDDLAAVYHYLIGASGGGEA